MIVNYNLFLIDNLPEGYLEEKYPQYLSPTYTRKKMQDHLRLQKRIGTLKNYQSWIDRTGNEEHFLDIKLMFPMPERDVNFRKSFGEISMETAEAALKENRKINIYWSGGLDSTNILLTFLALNKHKDQVKVLMNYNSVIESGYLFDTYVKPNFEYEIGVPRLEDDDIYFNKDEIYFTGQPNDQLGCSVISDIVGILKTKKLFAHTNQFNNLDTIYKDERGRGVNRFEDHLYDKDVKFFEKVVASSPCPIHTLEEFIWYIGFNYRWQSASFAPFHVIHNANLREEYPDVLRAFYNTNDFQQWGINKYEVDDRKNFVRKYLNKIIGDNIVDYTTHKKRTPSFYCSYKRNYLFTTDTFENIYVEDSIVKDIYNKLR